MKINFIDCYLLDMVLIKEEREKLEGKEHKVTSYDDPNIIFYKDLRKFRMDTCMEGDFEVTRVYFPAILRTAKEII